MVFSGKLRQNPVKSTRIPEARICPYYNLIQKIKNRKTIKGQVRALLEMVLTGVIFERVDIRSKKNYI